MNASARNEGLAVTLSDSSYGSDMALLDADANRLKDEIQFACSVEVRNAVSPAPSRSRPIDVPAVGTLIIALPLARQIVLRVLGLADTWLENRPTRRINLEFGNQKIIMEGLAARDIHQIAAKIAEAYEREGRNVLGQGSGAVEDG
jgi:hypothetical protein